MRELADAERIGRFIDAIGEAADEDADAYLAGGATAVLLGWRESTIDVDLALVPEVDSVLRALPELKEELRLNVELASPADFIPLPSGWRERSISIARRGRLSFHHFDFYSQALAKLERAHAQDLADVRSMLEAGVVEAERVRAVFAEIEQQLYRFPAIDPTSFRDRVETVLLSGTEGD